MPENVQELRGIWHPSVGLVSQRWRSDRRYCGSSVLLVARDESLPGGDRDDYGTSGPSIRLADHGQLDLICAWFGEPESADFREHGTAFLFCAVERRFYGRIVRSHALSNRRHSDSRSESAQG